MYLKWYDHVCTRVLINNLARVEIKRFHLKNPSKKDTFLDYTENNHCNLFCKFVFFLELFPTKRELQMVLRRKYEKETAKMNNLIKKIHFMNIFKYKCDTGIPKLFSIFHRNVNEFTQKQYRKTKTKTNPKKMKRFSILHTIQATLRQRIITDSISVWSIFVNVLYDVTKSN